MERLLCGRSTAQEVCRGCRICIRVRGACIGRGTQTFVSLFFGVICLHRIDEFGSALPGLRRAAYS